MLKHLKSALAGLPRDVRDTLFLLVVIGWVVLMQAAHIPLWCLGLTAALLGWRAHLTVRLRPLPGLWVRVALLALAVGATYATHRTILGRDAGVTLIVVLLALKTLELRARRDAFVVFFLSFFTLLTHFFYSQSLLTAIGILLALWGLLTALVNAHMPVGHPPLWRAARLAGGMALLGAPIMLVLFMLFPRMAPLWGIPGDGMTGRSGLSATVSVGNVASLALDSSVAMRVRFEGPPPPSQAMYFRGPVLSQFDGREWRPLQARLSRQGDLNVPIRVSGEPVRYQVTLEPNNRPWLLVLDATVTAPRWPGASPQDAYPTADLQWLLRRPVTDLMRYEAQSYTRFQHGPLQPVLGLQDHLELPPGFNPRTLALAQTMRRDAPQASAEDLVRQTLERLRTGGYTYTLAPGLYGRDTADEFWFDQKAGFCEHIASSFVVLMRALDIPARLVTGYQGGEINPVDGFFTVRQSDAHAWAEVWLAGRGWVRVDPTASVAPGRIDSLLRLRPQAGLFGEAIFAMNPDLANQLRDLWEATNNRWNQWVLNYTQSRQLDLLRQLGLRATDWTDLAYALMLLVVAASALGALWTLWEKRQHDPWLRLLGRARQRLSQAGVVMPPQATPRQLADLLPTTLPSGQQQVLRAWLMRLEAHRYAEGHGETPVALATLQRDFARLPWPSPSRPSVPPSTPARSN